MLQVLLFLILGGLLGVLCRERMRIAAHADRLTLAATWLLLFLLGVGLGSQQEILDEFAGIGLDAVIIASAAIVGSIAVCRLACRYIPMEKRDAK